MKKILLLLLLTVCCLQAHSQVYVKNSEEKVINLNTNDDIGLIRLIGVAKYWNLTNFPLFIDYGQELDLKREESYIVDSYGNEIEFESVIAAMNYIEFQGWEYLNDAYIVAGNSSSGTIAIAIYYYTFRKK